MIEVARPNGIDLAIKDGQAHLVAVTKRFVGLGVPRRFVIGRRAQDIGLVGDGVDRGLGRIGVGLGPKVLPPSMLVVI